MICNIVKNLSIKFRFLTVILYIYYILLNIIFENSFSLIISCYFLLLLFKFESFNICEIPCFRTIPDGI